MPRFSRKLVKFQPQKQFRTKSASISKTGFYNSAPGNDLHLFLEYDSGELSVINAANKGTGNVEISQPTHDFVSGPEVSFPTAGAGHYRQTVDQKLTITGLSDSDVMPFNGSGFLVAGWINLKSYDADGSGSNNGSCIISGAGLFDVFVNNTGNLGVRFYGANAYSSHFIRINTSYAIPLNEWVYFTIYLDASNPGDDVVGDSGVSGYASELSRTSVLDHTRILINGDSKALSLAYTANSIHYNHNSPNAKNIFIGYGFGEDSGSYPAQGPVFLHGYVADLILANGVSLANIENNLRMLYVAAKNGMAGYQSGYIDNPYRAELIDRQLHVRSPSLTIPGDSRAKGNHAIFFDDSNGQPPVVDTVNYSSKLFIEDNYLSSVYDNKSFFDGNLTLQSTSSTDYYETSRVFRSPALVQNIEPFVESRIYPGDNSDFYNSGSTAMPGFDQKLTEKDVVTISLQQSSPVIIGWEEYIAPFSYSSGGTFAQVYTASYMAYWDNEQSNLVRRSPFLLTDARNSSSTHHTAQSLFGEGGDIYSTDYLQRKNLNEANIGFVHKTLFLSASANQTIGPLNKSGDLETQFSSSYGFTLSKFSDEYYKSSGQPTDFYQFPDGDRYATSTPTTIQMKDYITEPFLVEKIVFDFPDIDVNIRNSIQRILFGPTNHLGFQWEYESVNGKKYANANAWAGLGNELLTAFLLRQYPDKTDKEIFRTQRIGSQNAINGTAEINNSHIISSTTGREIIGYGQCFWYHTLDGADSGAFHDVFQLYYWPDGNSTVFEWEDEGIDWFNNTGYDRFFNIVPAVYPYETFVLHTTTPDTSDDYHRFGDAIKIETTPKVVPKAELVALNDFKFPVQFVTASNDVSKHNAFGSEVYKWQGGPSNITKMISERHQGNALAGKFNESTVNLYADYSNNYALSSSIDYKVTDVTDIASTYLLLPEDNIIFGVQSQPTFGHERSQYNRIRINPGEIKITLYGSYLRDLKPKKQVRNQTLGFGKNISFVANDIPNDHDQFDLGTVGEYTGSMVDEVYGSVSALAETVVLASSGQSGLSNFHQVAMNRGRIGSVSGGTAGVFGSVTRNIRIDNDTQYEEHSLCFDVPKLFGKIGKDNTITESSSGGQDIRSFQIGDHSTPYNEKWSFSYIYDEYTIDNTDLLIVPFANDGFTTSLQYRNAAVSPFMTNHFSEPYDVSVYSDVFPILDPSLTIRYTASDVSSLLAQINLGDIDTQYRILVSIGPRSRGRHHFTENTANSLLKFVPNIRGLKYGLSNHRPSSDGAVFRRTSYGQFRDMLEQRRFTTLYRSDGQSGLELIENTVPTVISCRDLQDGTVLDLSSEVSKIKRNNKDKNLKSKKGFFDAEPIYNDPNAISDEDLIVVE
jgi:hypothetical protein